MPAFEPGAHDTNAKLVRALAQSLKNPSPNGKQLLSHCRTQLAFCTLAWDDASHLLAESEKKIISNKAEVRSLSLQTLFHVVRCAPPFIVRGNWEFLMQRLTSLIKSGKGTQSITQHAQVLTVLASVIAAAFPLTKSTLDFKPVISNMCQSAIQHAIRSIEPLDVSHKIVKASFAVFFAVLCAAPRELRLCVSHLEIQLQQRWMLHRCKSVRTMAAKLFAQLLDCYADKLKANVFEQRLSTICEQLDDMLNLLDMFTTSTEKRTPVSNNALKSSSAVDLQKRYSALCSCIRYMMSQYNESLLPVPLATIHRVLQRGIEERNIYAYATGVSSITLDTDGACMLANRVFTECAMTLVAVLQACGKDANVLFTHSIGSTVEEKLSHAVLRARRNCVTMRHVGLAERGTLYVLLKGMIDILGSGALPYVCAAFEEMFQKDIEVYVSCCKRLEDVNGNESGINVPELRRGSRKRKRYQQGMTPSAAAAAAAAAAKAAGEKDVRKDDWEREQVSEGVSQMAKQNVQQALKTATSIFEYRGFVSTRVATHVAGVEDGIMKLMDGNTMVDEVLQAASAAALSGGANRMFAERSELLMRCAKARGVGTGQGGDEMRRCRSGCESVFHARGAPFCYAKRVCEAGGGEGRVERAARGARTETQRDEGGGTNGEVGNGNDGGMEVEGSGDGVDDEVGDADAAGKEPTGDGVGDVDVEKGKGDEGQSGAGDDGRKGGAGESGVEGKHMEEGGDGATAGDGNCAHAPTARLLDGEGDVEKGGTVGTDGADNARRTRAESATAWTREWAAADGGDEARMAHTAQGVAAGGDCAVAEGKVLSMARVADVAMSDGDDGDGDGDGDDEEELLRTLNFDPPDAP